MKKAILIVDDQAMNIKLLSLMLESNYQIFSAKNGREAFDILKCQGNAISCIMLDIVMPVMNGREFLKHKREMKDAENVPVIIISSDTSVEEQKNMLKLGVHDYVTKPFIPEVMVRRVKNVLEYQHTFQLLLREYNKDRVEGHGESV